MGNLVIKGMADSSLLTQGLAGETEILMSVYEGSVKGGDVYTIVGAGLSNLSHKDKFTSISASWTNISSGSGTATASNGLKLNIGKTIGSAGLRTVSTYKNFDISLTYEHDSALEALRPLATVVFCRLQAYINANTRMGIEHKWSPQTGSIVYAYVYSDSVLRQSTSIVANSVLRTIRIVRYGGNVQMWIGSTMLLEYKGWHSTACNIDIASESSAAIPNVSTTTVSYYNPVVLITFGDIIAPIVTEADVDRIVGYTPPTKYPGLVDIGIHTVSNTFDIETQFNYIASEQLTISQVAGVMSINNDDTLRDTSVNLPGLRL